MPTLDTNLLSVGQLCDEIDAKVEFDSTHVTIRHHGEVLHRGLRDGSTGLYVIDFGKEKILQMRARNK